MRSLKENELEIRIEENGDTVLLKWFGRSRDRDPSKFLIPFFHDLIKEIKKNNKKLTVEFNSLISMNSSTVPPLVDFVKELNINNINTEIYYDINSEWQSASFRALKTIAKNLINIEVFGK